jgi:hypothetical protein
MIVPSKFYGYNKDGTRNLFMGGGGGGPTQTTSTVQNTNIPSYAEPYVNTMLGATQKQLFNTSEVGGTPAVEATYDDQGNQLTAGTAAIPGYTSIEGFKPYQAYGGTYDAQGKQLSYDPSKAVAGFQDTQLAAQRGIAGMQSQSGLYDAAQQYAARAGLGADQSAAQAYIYGQEGARAGAFGQGQALAASADAQALAKEQAARANKFGDAGFASGQKGQELGIAGGQLGIAGGAKYGDVGAGYGAQAAGLADPALAYGSQGAGYGAQGAEYGGTGAGYGAQAAQLANTALGYGQGAADIGQMALRAQGMGSDVARQSQNIAGQQALAGQQYAQMATDPRVTQALMNPYTQNVLDVQNKELQRQSDIAGTQRGAQAARAGAFGGSRQAIENAEANRSLAVMKNANQAQALQQAYQQAQAQQQFGANLNLQGLAGAQQGLGTALQGGQLGLSGLGTALQGQQGALSGVGQAGAMYGLGMQGAQTGMQGAGLGIQGTQAGLAGVNAANQAYQSGIQGAGLGLQGVNTQLSGVDRQLADTGQGMQGAQVGLAGVNAATAAGQLGLQGAQTGLQGTAQGMQGAQIGLQGVSGAQAGYGLMGQQASNFSNMLGQEQQNQLSLYGAQNQVGAQQQALEQAKINQSMLDYANAQQYPLMQLGTMSNMLRGLPMQASTTNQYAASPNPLSQAIGTIGAGTSIYNAYNPAPRGAAGGEVKGYAKGGIMSYDMGGEVESQLENMDEKGLQAQAKESSSPSIRRMAQRMLRERQMSKPQGTGPMGVQYQAAQPQMPSYAPGGIVAFATGGGANEEGGEDEAKIGMQQRLDMPAPTTGGIMGATAQPVTQVPVAPAGPSPDIVKEATRQRDIYSAQANRSTADVIKEIQAERDASGIGDNKAREEFRSQQMAERANMKDEQERQRNLRLAEFFASWGSTPGPVLVAGMNALKQAIPGIITDEKDAKKARKEADKIIYDIDEATRLDKLGMHNEATARREKAASHAQDFNKQLITFQSQRESDKRALEQTTMSTEAQLEAARIQAGAQKGATAQRAKETEMYNIERSLEISRNRLAKVEQDITSTRDKPPKGTPLAKAMESVNRYNNILEKNKGDASKVDDYIKKDAEQAAAVVKRFEDDAKRRLKDARDQVNMYEQTYLTQGRGAKSGAKPSAASNDPFEIMDILKESPAPAASANAPTKTSANAPATASAAAPANNSLASKIDKETNELGAGTRKAYSPDVQEYFDKLKAERKAGEAAYLKQQQQQMLTPLR